VRLIGVYAWAVISNWVATMGGVASLAVATALQWKWLSGPLKPLVWWSVASVCFAIAMFQAWSVEYRRRRQAEAVGPKIVMEHLPDQSPPRWRITNSGESDAMNIVSDVMNSYGTSARIEPLQRLPQGAFADLRFRIRRDKQYFGTYAHPVVLLDAVKKGAEETTETSDEYRAAIENLVIPVRLTYRDPRGVPFESLLEIRWNHFRHEGEARHVRAGPVG
jgi:hypothetical protein